MKKTFKGILLTLLVLVLVAVFGFAAFYFSRIRTIQSLKKVTDYEDYNLYRMDVRYSYDLDRLISYGISSNQDMLDAILKESIPLLPIHMKAPNYGCSAFSIADSSQNILMGRNYDFKIDTSSLLVHCTPKDGYESVAFAALSNISANQPDASLTKKIATLTAPFICLDGMNEKGVSIAVLTLDSEPTVQQTGKQTIFTTLAIRLVLDRAATTQEAVDLLDSYGLYADRVLPNQRNGIYGHGRERYDSIEAVLNETDTYTVDTAWNALKASAQNPNPNDVTSNTQWSLVYNDTQRTAQFVLRRDWDNLVLYDLNTNTVTLRPES